MGRRFGDVTADTQQVAAGQLRPLSGNTPAVAHNFGANLEQRFQPPDWVAARSSSLDGIRGTYPLTSKRRAAWRPTKACCRARASHPGGRPCASCSRMSSRMLKMDKP